MSMETIRRLKNRFNVLLEDHVYYRPQSGSRPLPESTQWKAPQAAQELSQNGLARFPEFVPVRQLEEVQKQIEMAYNGEREDLSTKSSDEMLIDYINEPFKLSPLILGWALNPFIVKMVEHYFQRPAYLADVDVRRIKPASMSFLEQRSPNMKKGYSSSHWHYDMRGKQIKVMIYLTDVDENGQNFAFCPGTHKKNPLIKRSRIEPKKSRFSDEWMEQSKFVVEEVRAQRGTAVLFDTNAIHRLRRKDTLQRDSITFYYTPGQLLRPLNIDSQTQEKVDQSMLRLLGGKR